MIHAHPRGPVIFDTQCGSCGKTYRLQDEMLGKRVRCKACGEPFAANAIAGSSASSGDANAQPSGAEPSKAKRGLLKRQSQAAAQPPSPSQPPPPPDDEPSDNPLAAAMALEAAAPIGALPELPPEPAPPKVKRGKAPRTPHVGPAEHSSLATAALVMSFLPCIPFVGLVLGVAALFRIQSSAGALRGTGTAAAAILIGIVSHVGFGCFAGIFLVPAYHAAIRTSNQMGGTEQVRAIHQGLVLHAETNERYMAGLTRDGTNLTADSYGAWSVQLPGERTGMTPANRFHVLLDGDYITADLLLSPSEEKTLWTGGGVTTHNFSYALRSMGRVGGGAMEWRADGDGAKAMVSDRRVPNGATDYRSIHADPLPGTTHWKGNIAWNDGSTGFYATDPTMLVDNLGSPFDTEMVYSSSNRAD